MKGVNFAFKAEPNGSVSFSNDRMSLTVHPDGTLAVSSKDPIQLTGASLAKLDSNLLTPDNINSVITLLLKRL